MALKSELREYFSRIGSIGGKKSKRVLTRKQALAMVEARRKKKMAREKQEAKQ